VLRRCLWDRAGGKAGGRTIKSANVPLEAIAMLPVPPGKWTSVVVTPVARSMRRKRLLL
jgi:hypothetical protein